jgi:two-component system, LuxR family, sensor kinase FixL
MSRTIHIILLEDCQDDARLILYELRRAGFDPIGERVESESEFIAQLHPTLDLILADYHVPQFDALRALRLVRERGLDVPVILVTGALGDETAVECLRQGAADYLLKDRLARLGRAVTGALEQKEARERQRRSDQALRDSEARKTAILESAVDAIITVDERGLVESMNPAAECLFGYAAVVVEGQNVNILMPPSYRGEHDRYLQNGLATGTKKLLSFSREIVGRKNDGTTFPMELTVSDVKLGDRRIFTWFARDIFERKQAEQRLKLAAELQGRNLELIRSNQDLDDFASLVAHELQEPMHGIQHYADSVLADSGAQLDPAGRSGLESLSSLARRMVDLINSLLEFSRVGRTKLALEETDLNQLLEEITDSLRVTLEEHDVEVRVPRPLPTIECDGARLGEVFRNLIANAIKYNDKPEKWVEISCGPMPGQASAGYSGNGNVQEQDALVLYVRDNGIGIHDENLDRIFGVFKRPNGVNECSGGHGIGLSIVKKIVERHGGRIWVDSTFGQGTTFSFTLGGAWESS